MAKSKMTKERGLQAVTAMFVVIAIAAGMRHEFVPAIICTLAAIGCRYRAIRLQKVSTD